MTYIPEERILILNSSKQYSQTSLLQPQYKQSHGTVFKCYDVMCFSLDTTIIIITISLLIAGCGAGLTSRTGKERKRQFVPI